MLHMLFPLLCLAVLVWAVFRLTQPGAGGSCGCAPCMRKRDDVASAGGEDAQKEAGACQAGSDGESPAGGKHAPGAAKGVLLFVLGLIAGLLLAGTNFLHGVLGPGPAFGGMHWLHGHWAAGFPAWGPGLGFPPGVLGLIVMAVLGILVWRLVRRD